MTHPGAEGVVETMTQAKGGAQVIEANERIIGIEPWESESHSGISAVVENHTTGERRVVTVYSSMFTDAEALAWKLALMAWPILAHAARRGE